MNARDARTRIDNALADIREEAKHDSERRRLALQRALKTIANDFQRASARAVREGRPLDPVEMSTLRSLARNAISSQTTAISGSAQDASDFLDFVIASVVATHVGIVASANGAEAGQRALDAFNEQVRRVPQNVQTAVRRLRSRDLEIPQLLTQYGIEATRAADTLLAGSANEQANGDDTRHDLFLLLSGVDIDYERYGVDRPDLTPLRGLALVGAMLVISETYNAMREGSWQTLAALGLVENGRWTVSSGHAGLSSSPDRCDDLATANIGFGAGRHPVAQWPGSPHPYCGCYMSDVRLADLQSWLARLP